MTHDFFEIAGKAFIDYLDRLYKPFSDIVGQPFPVMIMNTGDEAFLFNMQTSTEGRDAMYSRVPRLTLDVKAISVLTDQFTSNRQLGSLEDTVNGFPVKLKSTVRRIPVNWTFEGEAVFNNIFEYLQFTEVMLTMSHHNNYFSFVWSGSTYSGTFFLQEDIDANINLTLAYDSDKRSRRLPITFVVQLQFPSFDYYAIGKHAGVQIPANSVMTELIHNMHVNDESADGIVSTITITK